MKTTEKNIKFLVYAVIILLIVNLAALGTIIMWKFKANETSKTPATENNASFTGYYLKNLLEIQTEQLDEFRSIQQEFTQQARRVTMQLNKEKAAMFEEMNQANPDTIELNRHAAESGRQHAQLKTLSYEYFLKLNKLCTPEQRVKLKKEFETFFINDSSPANMGNGKGRQFRHGRNRNNK